MYVAPSMLCKPRITLMDTNLFDSLDYDVCGKPLVSVYWLGYINQTVPKVHPGREKGPNHACIQGPALRCIKSFKATDFCASFKRVTDEELQPKISIERINIPDSSITLQCKLKSESTGKFHWSLNGMLITNSAKYFQADKYLIIRNINNDDKYNIYTCLKSGDQFESDLYSIETSGPSMIKFIPSTTIIKEMDTMNVSCLTECKPLCSVTWHIPESLPGFSNIFLKNDVLQITSVTRKMAGNYTCIARNLITGASFDGSFSLNILFGPDKIVLNTSKSIIDMYELDSISILCTAECFPSCSIYWTEDNVFIQAGSGELNLINVSSNGTYTCHARNPSLDTPEVSQTINITVKIDHKLIPKIGVYRINVSDSSVVLHCDSFRKTQGMFVWMVNGSVAKRSDRYSPDNDFLYVRQLTAEDQNVLYTCEEPGSKLQSHPFWIGAYGPTPIRFSPNKLVVKEHDELNVSCLADCYVLCSFIWYKLDPSSGQKNVYSEGNILQIMDVLREITRSFSCKVQNILSGEANESTLLLDVLYGPDEILFNTSSNNTEVNELDSITILCIAKCVPPCLIHWKERNTQAIKRLEAHLILPNVKTDGTYTCHVTNPQIVNSTKQATISIKVKYDAKLTPSILIAKYQVSDSSIVLKCLSSRTYAGQFTWRINGSSIINTDKYSEDNQFLAVKELSADDQYNAYSCTEPGSGFQSEPFSIKIYGPDEIVFNTSETTATLYQFTSMTVSCFADCFPPCLFRWTISNSDTIIESETLSVVNVTSNASLTCHARNPIKLNATLSKTIDIAEIAEKASRKTLSGNVDKEGISSIIDIPTIRYLLHVVPIIGCFGVIIAVVCCLRKKYISCYCIGQESSNTINAQSDVIEHNQEETSSQQYWTIGTNVRGECFTVFDSDKNVEFRNLFGLSASNAPESEEQETGSNILDNGLLEIETSCLHSVKSEGYINPIHSYPPKCNDCLNSSLSSSIEFSEYIHPIHSNHNELDGYINPTIPIYKSNESIDNPVPLYHEQHDEYTTSAFSEEVESVTSSGSESVDKQSPLYHGQHDKYNTSICSEAEESDKSINTST